MGKKHGDKQKNTPKSERRERLLDVVERSRTTRVGRSISRSNGSNRRLPTSSTRSCPGHVVTQTRPAVRSGSSSSRRETSSRAALEELAAGNSRSTAASRRASATVEDHRRAMHELFAVTEQRGRESLEHLEALVGRGRRPGVGSLGTTRGPLPPARGNHRSCDPRAIEQISLGELAVAERAGVPRRRSGSASRTWSPSRNATPRSFVIGLVPGSTRSTPGWRRRRRRSSLESSGACAPELAHADAETEEWQARRETAAAAGRWCRRAAPRGGSVGGAGGGVAVGEVHESVERVRVEMAGSMPRPRSCGRVGRCSTSWTMRWSRR